MTLEDCADGTCYEGICPGHTVYTTDGKCSLAHGMQQCAGKWGDCCNMDGECGTGTDFCGLGKCQLGNCTTSALPPQGTSMPVFSFNFPPGIPATPTTATAMATGTTSTCRQNIYVIRGLFSLAATGPAAEPAAIPELTDRHGCPDDNVVGGPDNAYYADL